MILFPSPQLGDLCDIYISGPRSLKVLFLNASIDFFPEDDHAGWGLNAQPDLLAANLKDRYADVISDEEAFAGFSG
jgi:hypothetical protein